MGRKKKQEIKEPIFQPSKYQQDIFNYIVNDSNNILVEAVAGSGKTTTIIEALKLIPEDKNVLFCAFNKDIVKVLSKKTKKFPNTEVRTIHGLGYKVCIDNFPQMTRKIDLNKYWHEFVNNSSKYTDNCLSRLGSKKWMSYQKNVMRLFDLARLNLTKTIDDIINMNYRYGISVIDDEYTAVYKLMQWGSENTQSMDYTDMVWYPNIFDLDYSIASFDYIFVDEAQDLSKAQREFILKCNNGNTRYIFVGDSHQAIYGFSAADPESFNELRKLPNTTNFPLSVSYRCPKSVITFVHYLVPSIEAKEDAIEGEIIEEVVYSDIDDKDMILCRYNAPLFNAYSVLIQGGKKAFIMGKDIGKNLIDVIKTTKYPILNADLKDKGVFSELIKEYLNKKNNLIKTHGYTDEMCENDQNLINMKDNIIALMILAKHSNLTTTAQLIDKITKIFNDNISEGIILSTIHKAKGLEADNVYIIPHDEGKRKRKKWEEEQEKNLTYVAYTRAKRKLGFICDYKMLNNSEYSSINNCFDYAKEKIDKLYSNDYKPNPVRLQSIFPDVGKTLGNEPKRTNLDSLDGLLGKKKKLNK